MSNYYLVGNKLIDEHELMHYGVKGMKWGIRKSDYDAMDKVQKKATRKKYYETDEGKSYKITRNTIVGTLLGGPLVGVVAGVITAKRNPISQEYKNSKQAKAREKINSGKNYVEKLATKRTVEIKPVFDQSTRITGEEEAEFWKAYAKYLTKQK